MAAVTIACKLPNGLRVRHAEKEVELVGANHSKAIAGFGLTKGVDSDWFASWKAAAGDFPPLKNGSIFAQVDAKAADEAAEKADIPTGLEGLDPDKPAAGIEPTDEMKAEIAKAGK